MRAPGEKHWKIEQTGKADWAAFCTNEVNGALGDLSPRKERQNLYIYFK